MKSNQSLLMIAATMILAAAMGLSPAAARNLNARQDAGFVEPAPPIARLPMLRIVGQEDQSVYLQSLDINVEVTGNIASTRYTMVFKNKTGRILEGELTFPLPDGRTVTRYALDINGRMREAVPVEKARATQVFEEIQQRQVDPGLLERVEGNNYRTRIYPIPANGERTVSIGYEEELTLENGQLRYRLPMAYADPIEKFSVKATVWMSELEPIVPEDDDMIRFDRAGENYVATFARDDYRPSRALIFALPAPADIPRVMMQSAQGSFYFLASIAPNVNTRKKQWGDELAIIWDVSLSGSQRNLQREMEALDVIFADRKDVGVNLYYLNSRLTKTGQYRVNNGNWSELKRVLESAVFDGGTDFSQIDLNGIIGNEILFFSDGLSTLSDADFIGDVNGVNNVNTSRPIHAIVSSSKADYSVMRLISGKTKGKFVNLNALSSAQLKAELLNETLQFLGVEHGDAVSEVHPSIASPVQGNFSIAGISDSADTELTVLFGFGNNVEKSVKVKLNAQNASRQGDIHRIWAQKKIAELDLNYEANRAELTELGQQFGIVTRNTSLIVLEDVGDYVRFDIEPPASEPELLAEYQRRRKGLDDSQRDMERDMLNHAVAAAQNITKWWNTGFKNNGGNRGRRFPTPDESRAPARDMGGSGERLARSRVPGGWAILLALLPASCSPSNYHGSLEAPPMSDSPGQPVIRLSPIRQDSEYMRPLTGKLVDDYQTYLKLRDDYANSPPFYFDMADWFFKLDDRETALRILTSIAELEIENASLYRLLGYRLKEYGEYALQNFVCKKVIEWRPFEPQSYRDYALALADNGEDQAALDSLHSLLTKTYSANINRRSRGMEEVVIMEMNRLIARNPELSAARIDNRLIIKTPVDVRVVINWNMNNTDIDLHVTDPNGQECYYRNRQTHIGGRISHDNTSGYGPEQFILRNAVRGTYRIYVNHYSTREFTPDGPATVMAEIYTKYADSTEQRKVVSLQLSKAGARRSGGKVEVAEFRF